MTKLSPKSDLFGHVLYDYLKDDKTPYGIRRNDGWYEFFPQNPIVYFKHGIYGLQPPTTHIIFQ